MKHQLFDTHFVWPQWVRLLSHTTLDLTLFPCYVLRQSIHPPRQACPFIPIRITVNSWSQPWLGLIRLPDTMDTRDRQISKQPMGKGTYIDSYTSWLYGGKLVTEMKSYIINWFKWESHTHSMGVLKHKLLCTRTDTCSQRHKVRSNQSTLIKLHSRLNTHTRTLLQSFLTSDTQAASHLGHKGRYEKWGGQKFMRRRSHERIPESSANDLKWLWWDFTHPSFHTHLWHKVNTTVLMWNYHPH